MPKPSPKIDHPAHYGGADNLFPDFKAELVDGVNGWVPEYSKV